MKYLNSLMLTIFVVACTLQVHSQEYRSSSIDINAGISLTHMDVPGEPNFLGSIAYKYTPFHPLSLRAGLTGGTLSGSDNSGNFDRHFVNNIVGVTAGADLNLFALTQLTNPSKMVDPYLSAEIGAMYSSIASITEVEGYGTTQYEGVDITFGLGGGLRFYLTPSIDLNTRYTFYIPNSDVIDGHNPDVAANDAPDYYSGIQVGVNLKLGNKENTHQMWASRSNNQQQKELAELKKKDKEKAKEVMGSKESETESSPTTRKKEESTSAKMEEESNANEHSTDAPMNKRGSTEKATQKSGGPDHTTMEEDEEEPAYNAHSREKAESKTNSAAKDNEAVNKQPAAAREKKDNPASEKTENEKGKEQSARYSPDRKKENEASEKGAEEKPEYNIYTSRVMHPDGTTGNFKYYIIVGSYTTLNNAENFISNQSSGESMEIITDYHEQHYRVVIDKTNNLEDALSAMNVYKKQLDPKTWVLENTSY